MKKYLTKYEFRWALIFTLVTLLWTAFEYEMGWHDKEINNHRYYTILFFIPATLVYVLFLLDKKSKRFKKRFKFKHIFYSCLGLSFFIALFSIPAQLLVHSLVSPDFISNAQESLIASGEMTTEDAYTLFTRNTLVLFFPILYLTFGIVLSVILGFVFKK